MGSTYGELYYGAGYYGSAVILYQEPGSGARVMNLAGLVTEAQRLAGRVDSNFDDRTKQWINEALDRWVVRDPWKTLTLEEDFLTDGTRDLYLPNYMRKILSIFDKSNKLEVERHENWDREDPSSFADQTSGRPHWWRECGMSPVIAQPSAAKEVEFNPDAVEHANCYVHGIASSSLASGTAVQRHVETEYVTCMSGAAASSTRNFVEILTIGKDALTSGDVIVRYSGVTEPISRIEANSYRAEFRHVQFLQKPAAQTIMTIKYIRRMEELTQDSQILPPSVNPRFLVWWAAGNIHSAMSQAAQAREKWAMAEQFIKEESFHETAHGDQDWSMNPDPGYWTHDDLQAWPP